jgi:hypothetical protein
MSLFFKFLITTLFLILIYVIYRSEIHWGGSNRPQYLIYLIGIVLAIFFFIVCTYLNVNIQKYVIIIFISTVFTFYCMEGFLTFFSKIRLLKLDSNFDVRTVHEVYIDLKNKKKDIVHLALPISLLREKNKNNFYLAGISNTETLYCNENGYYNIYKSDRYGFNNPDGEWNGSEIEYILLGDSFIHGACVNRPNDVTSVLRLYSKGSALNLSMPGNGPLIQYATLREYVPPKVKKVMWFYYEGNDVYNLESELKDEILQKYLNDQNFSQNLKSKQNKIDNFLKLSMEKDIEEPNKFIAKNFLKLFNLRILLLHSRDKHYQLRPPPDFKIILNLANNLVKQKNGELYFIYLPQLERYKLDDYINHNKFIVKKIVDDLNIKFIDIDEEVFKKEKNPLKLFPYNGVFAHYNTEGYKKIALKIYEKTK